MASDQSQQTSSEKQATTLSRPSQSHLSASLSRKPVSRVVLLTRSVRLLAKPSRQTSSLPNGHGSDARFCSVSASDRASSILCCVVDLRHRRSPSLSASSERGNRRSL